MIHTHCYQLLYLETVLVKLAVAFDSCTKICLYTESTQATGRFVEHLLYHPMTHTHCLSYLLRNALSLSSPLSLSLTHNLILFELVTNVYKIVNKANATIDHLSCFTPLVQLCLSQSETKKSCFCFVSFSVTNLNVVSFVR